MTTTAVVVVSAAVFVVAAIGVVVSAHLGFVTPQFALLALVGLLGLYVGFGILIGIYCLLRKLE